MDIVERTLELVSIPSVIGNEGPICDRLLAELAAVDAVQDGVYELQRIEDNLVVWPKRRGRPLLALVGHLDTVPPTNDNPPRRRGDRIYGLGASDMKGGVALMWQLLAEPVADPAYDLACIFYAAEEGPFEQSGLKQVIARFARLTEIDLAICLEPSDNKLQLGCLGSMHARVTFEGRSAHSARPWHGDNAIHQAAGVLARLAAQPGEEVHCGGLTYREVISATLAEGGRARNVVPDRFTLNVNFRFAPGRELASARGRIEQLVDGEASIEIVDQAPSGPIPEDNPLLAELRRRCPVEVEPKQAWTDIARLAAAGIDAINFGPGQSDQCHQPDEHASIPHLIEGERLLRAMLSKP